MSSKVYIVTSGCYSDYGVEGVFSTRENAQKVVDLYSPGSDFMGEWRIEEFELDRLMTFAERGKQLYSIEMEKDGTVVKCNVEFREDLPPDEEFHYVSFKSFPCRLCLITHVIATSKEHAIKIANERRAFLIANNLWAEEQSVGELIVGNLKAPEADHD